jgi:SAM-dependent methyltransferase
LFGVRGLLYQHDPPTYDRWLWLRRVLDRQPGWVLDAGSGSGAFAMYTASIGHRAIGLSFDAEANRVATHRAQLLELERVRFDTADLRRLDQLAPSLGRFDQILCLETIEHLWDDQKLIHDISRLLVPGGRLYLTTPTAGHRPLLGEQLSSTEDGGHVRWGYTAERIEELLRDAGIRVRSVDYLSGVVTQRITNLSRRLAKRLGVHAAWALTAPVRILRPLDRSITRLTKAEYLAIAVVGVKA